MKIRQLPNKNNSKVREKEEQVELWIETSSPWMARKSRNRETRVCFFQGIRNVPPSCKIENLKGSCVSLDRNMPRAFPGRREFTE